MQWFNRLLLESGMTGGLPKLALFAAIGGGVVFAGLYAVARVTLWLDVRKAARLRLRAAD